MSKDMQDRGKDGKFSRGIAGTERVVEDVEAWCAAWRFVTAVSAARVYGVDFDRDAMFDGTNEADVAAVLIEFVGRVLDALGPARAAEVVQRWGVLVTCAEGVA